MPYKRGIARMLGADATLVADLAEYEFDTGVTEPSIHTTGDMLPTKAKHPAVLITQVPGGSPWGVRQSPGYDIMLDVDIYGNKGGNEVQLRRAAMRIKRVLDRARGALETQLAAESQVLALCMADPPVELPDPNGYPRFTITVRIQALDET